MNVYHSGASLLNLAWSNEELVGRVHYKYLLRPTRRDGGDEYVKVRCDGHLDLPEAAEVLLEHLDAKELIKAIKPYTGEEKNGVHRVAMSDRNAVVDVEVAISDGEKAPRIDLAALVDTGDAVTLRFFEAKAFGNPELRAREEPNVVGQIARYERLLRDNRAQILKSYGRVCDNFHRLKGMDTNPAHRRRRALIESVVSSKKPLVLDERPRLVIFGFDQDQKDGSVWKGHREKLVTALEEQRVLDRGKPGDIKLDGL